MVHHVMNDLQNLVWPHYGECIIFAMVLMVCLVVIHMFDIFPLMCTVRLRANQMGVSKALYFSQAIQHAQCALVTKSLYNILRKLLVLDDIQHRQRN